MGHDRAKRRRELRFAAFEVETARAGAVAGSGRVGEALVALCIGFEDLDEPFVDLDMPDR
jgi:hypothetical protein